MSDVTRYDSMGIRHERGMWVLYTAFDAERAAKEAALREKAAAVGLQEGTAQIVSRLEAERDQLRTALEESVQEREKLRKDAGRWYAVRLNASVSGGEYRLYALDKSKHTLDGSLWSGGARLELAVDEFIAALGEPRG